MSDSLPPHGPYSGWNSLGQKAEVGSRSFFQGIFPTQVSNPGLPHCRQILYQLNHQRSPRTLEWVAYPISTGSSQPGNEPGSPALQEDSLPAEPPGKPMFTLTMPMWQLWETFTGLQLTLNIQHRVIYYYSKFPPAWDLLQPGLVALSYRLEQPPAVAGVHRWDFWLWTPGVGPGIWVSNEFSVTLILLVRGQHFQNCCFWAVCFHF